MATNSKDYLDHISLDCVIFGFHDNELKVLLLKHKTSNRWSLPGGFLMSTESLEAAATRVLKERTGVDNLFLRQFKVFSDPERTKIQLHLNSEPNQEKIKKHKWYGMRFISIGFYALVNFSNVTPRCDNLSDRCEWKNLSELPGLMFDHEDIINEALQTLRIQLNYQPIGNQLLPDKFTMPELQRLYETILGKSLDRRNFQRKILSFKILNKLNERKKGGAHKSPFLYEFNLENYQKALDNSLSGGW